MAAKRASRRLKHRLLKWVGGLVLAALAAVGVAVLILAYRAEPMLRALIVQELSEYFHARVELDSFHFELRDGLWAEGKGLRIWPSGVHSASGDAPLGSVANKPLIQLAQFRFHAPLRYKPGEVIRISVVQLKGLDVDIPPRPPVDRPAGPKKPLGAETAIPGNRASGTAGLLRFEVDRAECTGALLTIETSKPGKLPLEFAISHLRLSAIQAGGPMRFEAELTNPRPVGTISTSGKFGPWVVSDPGESPLAGDYNFDHADLGGFKGIGGILSSAGHYDGTLRNLTVDGETDTPDFRLTHFGTALDLRTKFHARVDGTNGDTWLEPVEATLGGSHFWARGRIVRVAPQMTGEKEIQPGGHEIALRIDVDRGKVEDFLRLASRSGTSLLTGDLAMKADLEIPPGADQVDERLKLAGTFDLENAQFASSKIQSRIAELSARGQGKPKEAKAGKQADVRSTMTGSFQMEGGMVKLSALQYTVPGAVIDLKGKYEVESGALDFAGTAKMDAKVSQMVGGWKGILLKPVDRYFEKQGAGTMVPIHINGTRESPQFGVDFNRMKGSAAQRPDEPSQTMQPKRPGDSAEQPR